MYAPQSGSVRFAGAEILGLPAHKIAKKGIARTFQNVEVFPAMTVLDNLLLSRHNGTQEHIELARALAMEPRLIMLDEPVAGMNHDETAEMTETIVQVNRDLGVAILLVEHDMKMVMGISNRVCVLNFGQRIALGKPAEVIRDEAVVAAYLGAA
ncbi:ABC transporter ATP-binding protein [Rhodococcus sp. TAF43]|uniref:ABC transporter ATP-binding protein n=1 Tax=unclassified Rhodococcus (in: high G+C Gram-positive bacteria) TaxID=192944 RepID=UPI0020C680AB|nr:hypothetical protein [Rhodococcus sp. W8901]